MEKKNLKKAAMIFLEGALFFFFFLMVFSFSNVDAVIGEPNATVITNLSVGKSAPNILNIDIHQGSIFLIPNSTKTINCTVEIEDFDGDIDIINVTAEFFHSSSFYGDDYAGNHHYSNDSCYIDIDYGDEFTVLAHCLFEVQYYANPGTWNCTAYVEDVSEYSDEKSNTTVINELLAIGLPDIINYGTINATYVSEEQIANVTNFGNVQINLSLEGYAREEGDGLAMNCTLGGIGEINVTYQRYNLTDSNPGTIDSLSEFNSAPYINLTSSPTVRRFNLNYKQDDTAYIPDNSTYWRIYVPLGVAGTCQGNIVFGATKEGE